jgi:aminomethyltransferase
MQEFHEKNGHLTEFVGFNLPLWFKGIIPESLAVRNSVGIFDVSHMGRALIRGRDSCKLLDTITTNDVASLPNGMGQYSLICNPDGCIKDDVLVFRLRPEEYLFVYNAGNRSKDYDWMTEQAQGLSVEIQDVSDQVAMFAVQGPKASPLLEKLSGGQVGGVRRFGCAETQIADVKVLVTRTGYTGEDGFEVFVWDSPLRDPRNAQTVWGTLSDVGKQFAIEPCGLGARDLLRLEAGLCLYGADIDENTNPFEARLGFVVKLHKEFIGKSKLQEVKSEGPAKVRVGLLTGKRVIPRHGFNIVREERKVGSVTSGTLSPLLNTGIAMGYVTPESSKEGTKLIVEIRGRSEEVRVVKPPFYDPTKYGYLRTSN